MIENSTISGGKDFTWNRNFFLEERGTKKYIDARIMQPFLYNEIYEKHNLLEFILANEIQKDSTLYKSPGLLGADYGPHMENEVRKMIKDIGRYIPSKEDHILFGNGSTNLIYTIIHIFARYIGTKHVVVTEQSPYYDAHKHIAEENGCEWIPSENLNRENTKQKFLIEIITSPNNPDGEFRKPFKGFIPHVIIADLVYDWPWTMDPKCSEKKFSNQVWMDEYNIKGSLIFPINSFSKSFGLAGQRCGFVFWPIDYCTKMVSGMFYDDSNCEHTFHQYAAKNNSSSKNWTLDSTQLLAMAQRFIAFCTYGISPDAFYACQAVNLLYLDKDQYLINALEEINCILKDRRKKLECLLSRHGFEVRSGPGLASIWGKLVDEKEKSKTKNTTNWFRKNFGLLVYGGELFNSSKWYARINLLISTKDFDTLVERLECE